LDELSGLLGGQNTVRVVLVVIIIIVMTGQVTAGTLKMDTVENAGKGGVFVVVVVVVGHHVVVVVVVVVVEVSGSMVVVHHHHHQRTTFGLMNGPGQLRRGSLDVLILGHRQPQRGRILLTIQVIVVVFVGTFVEGNLLFGRWWWRSESLIDQWWLLGGQQPTAHRGGERGFFIVVGVIAVVKDATTATAATGEENVVEEGMGFHGAAVESMKGKWLGGFA